MTVQLLQTPSPAGEELFAYRAVYETGGEIFHVTGADQAAVQQVVILGVTTSGCAEGDLPNVAIAGGDVPFECSAAVAQGAIVVATYTATAANRGQFATWATPVDGDCMGLKCTEASTAAGSNALGTLILFPQVLVT